jgi:Amt family ammonium transporter
MSLIILLVLKFTIGLRVTEEEEREGLDIVLHGEQVF